MRKFSKILESNINTQDIKYIFMDLIDIGFKIDVKYFQGLYNIELSSIYKLNWMEIIEDLIIADKRMKKIGLKFKSSNEINLGGSYKSSSKIHLKYTIDNQKTLINKNINGWRDFKSYCNEILGIDGIYGKEGKYTFRLNVANREG